MERVKTPWKGLSMVTFFLFGLPFTTIGIFMYIIKENTAFLINGLVWVCLGLGLALFNVSKDKKDKQLVAQGTCYEGSIVEVKAANLIKIGSYITAKVICRYSGKKGEKTATSGFYLLSPLDRKEDYTVMVYVDESNNDKHYVELYRK